MNWVGGFRTRVMFKQERRKQKEYFEKKKLKSKKFLEVLSPSKNSSVNLDLLTLYIVNQISIKKGKPATVRKPTFVNISTNTKIPIRKHNFELLMPSHYKSSNSYFDDTENRSHHQKRDIKNGSGPVEDDTPFFRILGEEEDVI
ncbi:regulator of DNA class I crossover intermediates 1 isoform X2 [Macrotis lagotis]|uniref:regulator of DNA class I crossover intermediates 1 isoform X2 n=1 Tax=Macrotis lagotis TaxID=92651 RepID=UPI003D698C4D